MDGLLGLTWRTWETSPQISALARAGWELGMGSSETAVEFWKDWCSKSFGFPEPSRHERCIELFMAVDSFSVAHVPGTGVTAGGSKLPRQGQKCCGGPMTATAITDAELLNVSGFEAWLPTVTDYGPGVRANDAESATAWTNLFRYHRQTQVRSEGEKR